jgi:hypothetical protein
MDIHPYITEPPETPVEAESLVGVASTGLLAPLRVAVEAGELVIRIGCSRIDGNDCHPEIPELPITDPHAWGQDIANEMMRDRGDGATPLCLFMDEMIHEAISMGATGIDHKRLAEIRRANDKILP